MSGQEVVVLGVLVSTVDSEPRITHLELARILGYSRPDALAKLINEHAEKLNAFGILASAEVKSGERGRPARVFYLNRKQVLWVCAKSGQEVAVEVTMKMVHVFDEVLDGRPSPDVTSLDRRAELDLRNRELVLKAFEFGASAPNLPDDSRQMLHLKAVELVTGMNVTRMLPAVDYVDWKSPTEIAQQAGVTPQRVGLTISVLNLRGNVDGMSRGIANKAVGHTRQVTSYLYSPAAVEKILAALGKKAA